MHTYIPDQMNHVDKSAIAVSARTACKKKDQCHVVHESSMIGVDPKGDRRQFFKPPALSIHHWVIGVGIIL
jgi:hypothetical protein